MIDNPRVLKSSLGMWFLLDGCNVFFEAAIRLLNLHLWGYSMYKTTFTLEFTIVIPCACFGHMSNTGRFTQIAHFPSIQVQNEYFQEYIYLETNGICFSKFWVHLKYDWIYPR